MQFLTDTGSFTTGSHNLTYYTASYLGYQPSSLVLSGNMYVTGTISASIFHVEDIALIDATGSTFFGNSVDDTHMRTGSLVVSGTSDYVLSASATTGRTWVRGFGARYRKVVGVNTILQASDYLIGCSHSAGANQTLWLPTASVVGAGAQLVIKDQYHNRPATSVYISASQHASPHQLVEDTTYYHLTGTMPAISLYSDGTNWFVY